MPKSIPATLKNMKKWFEPEENEGIKRLYNTLPFQRKAGMWNNFTKSMLVRSVIQDDYIPPLVFLKEDEVKPEGVKKSIAIYQIEDGQQRLTSLFDFIDGKYKLHSSTPDANIDGIDYQLAGKVFDELEDKCKDELLSRSFNIQIIEEYTPEEAEELFYLINSGVALSPIQKSKSRMGTDTIAFFMDLLQGTFFTQSINISAKQAQNEDDLLTLIQASILFDNKYSDNEFPKSIGAPACLAYADTIRNSFNEEQEERISEVVTYLDKAFTNDTKVKFFHLYG